MSQTSEGDFATEMIVPYKTPTPVKVQVLKPIHEEREETKQREKSKSFDSFAETLSDEEASFTKFEFPLKLPVIKNRHPIDQNKAFADVKYQFSNSNKSEEEKKSEE